MPAGAIVTLLVVGLAAGALGGMLGIGGSIIMIPVLTIALGHNVHVAQAAALIINVCVSVPAMLQHHRAAAVRWDVFRRMLIPATICILIGVESSNVIDPARMERIFGVFLIYVALDNILRLARRRPEPVAHQQRVTWLRCGAAGALMGFFAGLLGVGGGVVAVPLLQKLCRLPLRQCIATTAACMCISAAIGALRKNFALPSITDASGANLGLSAADSLRLAAVLAPTAIVGGLLGGRLAHTLPLGVVRAAFIVLMVWASAEMLGVI